MEKTSILILKTVKQSYLMSFILKLGFIIRFECI
jgi:hypothetical protein